MLFPCSQSPLNSVRIFGAALVLIAAAVSMTAQQPSYDILIKNAQILDGAGNPWYSGIIAIKGGKIAAIGYPDGPLRTASATRTIDGTGLVATPGFIDLHGHSDTAMLADGKAESKIRDGVTMEVMGEMTSVAPRDGLPPETDEGVPVNWTTFTDYFNRLRKQGISMNVASSVAAAQIRLAVMGYTTAAATPQQIAKMEQLTRRSMEEGAVGLVTLFESGGPDHPEEILDLAKIAASYGGYYSSHIGSEGFQQTKELQFAFRVAKEDRMPVHIFHFKIRAKDNWGTMQKYVSMVEEARASGLDVTANQYPYTAMTHPWFAFFPVWAREGGPQAFAERLNSPAQREKIKNDPDFKVWSREHGGWDGIVVSLVYKPDDKKYEGKTVAEVAKMRGDADPADTCLWLEANEGGMVSGIYHTMSEEDVRLVMKQPWVSISADGEAINLDAPGFPHPRSYSTNARVLGYYSRDEHVLTLPDAVRKMTGLPAQIMGLTDRGQLHAGYWADVVLFDPKTVGETNSYEKPKSYVKGIPYVIVNGVLVVDGGQHTGAKPGMVILGKGYKAGTK